MTTPTKEWREELKEGLKEQILTAQRMIGLMQPKSEEELIAVVLPNLHIFTHNFIENLLDQHSAHLVERLQDMAIVDDYGEERKIGFQIAKDQAIDIVKDNK